MKLEKIEGYFDCRKFKAGLSRNQREFNNYGERINFSVGFADEFLPAEIAEFANKSEKSGINYVNFKIFPKNCKFYLANAKQIQCPEYQVIDGGKFLVNLSFNIKHGKGTEANGCYVNAIQIIRRTDNIFDAVEDGDLNVFEEKDPFAEKDSFDEKLNNVKIDNEPEEEDLPF